VNQLFSQETKKKIFASFEEDRQTVEEELKQVLSFPYHPDTKLLVFELEGYSGDFGLKPFAMKDSYIFVDEDANGTPLYETPFDQFAFGVSAYEFLQDELEHMDDEEIGELDDFAIECLCEWFSDLFQAVKDKSFTITGMIKQHDHSGMYSLQDKKWVEDEEV
jgi:hypothetical protein